MIRLTRSAQEPPELNNARAIHLKKLRALIAQTGEDPLSDEIKGYRVKSVAEILWKAQNKKCCYCEKQIELDNEDIEHFRPKAKAERGPGSLEQHGYWWLAYTWDNLLYACGQCNNNPAKGNQFPLDLGSQALVAEQQPPGQEKVLLIHPLFVDPMAHIEFRPAKVGGKERWIPRARNNSSMGESTIRVCRLDRSCLVERYTKHVNSRVWPEVEKFRRLLNEADSRVIWKEFYRIQRNLLGPQSEFTALSLDALRYLIPESELHKTLRGTWKL